MSVYLVQLQRLDLIITVSLVGSGENDNSGGRKYKNIGCDDCQS